LIRVWTAASLMGLCLAASGSAAAAPNARIEGVSDGALRGELEAAVGEARGPPASALEARRRANQAVKDATALLRSEGFYEAVVSAEVTQGPSPAAVAHVTLGPRFLFADAAIDWSDGGPEAKVKAAVQSTLGLKTGAPGRAADVLAAEGRLIASLKAAGYADAAVLPRHVVVDHADHTVRPSLRIKAGRKVVLGALRPVSAKRTNARWLAGLATWKPGAVYSPALLARLEKRLIDTGAYQSATVTLATPPPGAAPDAPRPVDVTLFDRPRHSLELGAGYSTTEGSGADAKYTIWNRLGRADSLIFTIRGYDIQQKLDVEQDLPDWAGVDQTLKVGGGFLGDRTPAYNDVGGGVRLDVVKKYARTTAVNLGLAFDYASTQEKDAVNLLATPVGESLDLYMATLKSGFTLDRSNSILDPSKGWRLQLEADPTWITGGRNLTYLKTEAQLTGYEPLGHGLPVVAARVRFGSILGGSIPDVPADRRFYAGGGGSVRGYGYQAVGPQLSDGTPVGGLSLTEGSVELRQALSRRWGVVAFADAGGLGSEATPSLRDLSVGVGLGVRYDLGFAPLRLDLGTPLNPRHGDSPIQVYISIGQAF
jgi:translocation and assembly module TamA